MLYSAKVMDHFMNPRNVGIMEDADGVGQVGSARCGDTMKIYLKIQDGIITRATSDIDHMENVCCHCFQFHGNGIDYRKAPVTGTGSHQSGRGRDSGRAAGTEAALFRAGRAGSPCRGQGLLRPQPHSL